MPTATVLYFAHLRERLGRDRDTIEVPARADAAGLSAAIAAAIAQHHPAETAALARCRLAVDHAFVQGPVDIRAGAEIAVIPPVSGG
jgi:molybdopterin synthase catalytic subunit